MKKRSVVTTVLTLLSWGAFEAFNFASTRDALDLIIGSLPFTSWLAIGLCAVDFAALAEIMDDPKSQFDDVVFGLLKRLWLIVAASNAALTWFVVAHSLQTHQSAMASIYPVAVTIAPIFVALIVLAVRVMVVRAVLHVIFPQKGQQQ